MPSEIRRIMQSGKGLPRKRLIACFLHIILWPILLIPRIFWPWRRARPLADGSRALFIRIDGIGDLVMTSSIFPALRRKFPGVRINVLTSNQAIPIAELLVAAGGSTGCRRCRWWDEVFEISRVWRDSCVPRNMRSPLTCAATCGISC